MPVHSNVQEKDVQGDGEEKRNIGMEFSDPNTTVLNNIVQEVLYATSYLIFEGFDKQKTVKCEKQKHQQK